MSTLYLADIVLGMGCFWGAEKRMSQIPGVHDVESGYANGERPITDYQTVLSVEKARQLGLSNERNHAEVVRVYFDPTQVSLTTLLAHFWENHNPTQGDRQGNDVGSNYRSAIYFQTPEQETIAHETLAHYQRALNEAGWGKITTEIAALHHYNRAEEYHQDYLQKHPQGYCGLGGTGVAYPR
ncbi:MAG: peptide-methionine (S)-S-oxide reductase MsrA [Thiotrichales bacterium]|nr:peptide-methionine (S)-S-oxide reductase MsrA [Thiotrichales bacterium]